MYHNRRGCRLKASRRTFLVASGLTALASARAAGANNLIRVGAIGCGGRMRDLLNAADKAAGYQLVVGCDVYAPRLDQLRERSSDPVSVCEEYRELLDRPDIDAVIIAAPDHWHLRIASDALAAGKHVYLEKPVSHTIEEGRTLTKA